MSITAADIVIYESERMTDEDNGGGKPTGNILPDNTVNALFPKTSRMDRTQGVTNMRKLFCGVRTNNAEAYQGSHFIVDKDAQDAHTNLLVFAGAATDTRAEARSRIEQYLVPGYSARIYILGDAYAGQRSILLFQEVTAPIPELGGTLYLYGKNPDTNLDYEEYIKVGAMDVGTQTFTYELGGQFYTITRRVLTIKLSGRLKYRWYGGQPYPTGVKRTDTITPANVLTTNVADASRYYGVSALKNAAIAGDVTIRVTDVYKPIVPAAYSENLITDRLALAELSQICGMGASQTRTYTFALVSGSQSRTYLERIPKRGTLTLTIEGGVYKDPGNGTLIFQSGTDNYSKITVNFENGQVDIYRKSSSYISTATATFIPAASIIGAAISFSTDVSVANRTFNWTFDLSETIPEPGSVTVMYRALGKWQILQDDGTGQLSGNGTGSVSFTTGSLAVTCSALPDAESKMIISYIPAGALEYTSLGGQSLTVNKEQTVRTTYAMVPDSVVITWTSGGVARTLTDDTNGALTGYGTGTASYARKVIKFIPTGLPDDGTYTVSYLRTAGQLLGVAIPSDPATPATFTVGQELVPGKTSVTYNVTRYSSVVHGFVTGSVTLTDDGAGHLLRDGVQVGTIAYANGQGSFSWSKQFSYDVVTYTSVTFGPPQKNVETITTYEGSVAPGNVMGLAVSDTGTQTDTITVNMPPLEFTVGENLISKSLWFIDNGNHYIERDNVLWKNPDSRTGGGSRVGTVSLGTGGITIDDPKGITGSLSIVSGGLLTKRPFINSVVFRTPGSPIKPANLQLIGSTAYGVLVNASLDATGALSGDGVTGTVNVQHGLVLAQFATPVSADTLRYNTVILTSIPLDSDLIGLDPIRLPPDGKVPIYQDGEVLVLTHTASFSVGTPTAGQVIDATRDYLADCWFTDSAGTRLSPDQYIEDRDNGMITMKTPLSLVDVNSVALVPPLTFHHRIEHMSLIQDVQISGDITLAIPLAQDYPANETMVSSALRMGDRFASWGNQFVQQTWSSTTPNWTHTASGNPITANFDWANYPLQVTNQGAVDDEWALVFTSATTFDVISKDRGKLGSGTTTANTAIINPNTSTPYFVLDWHGFSAGWVSGNVIRFTTISALYGLWLLRCISVGRATHPDDSMSYQQRGDA